MGSTEEAAGASRVASKAVITEETQNQSRCPEAHE